MGDTEKEREKRQIYFEQVYIIYTCACVRLIRREGIRCEKLCNNVDLCWTYEREF